MLFVNDEGEMISSGSGSNAPGLPRVPYGPGALVAERYLLRDEIGSGGMGRVFVADDRLEDREVALKICYVGARSNVRDRFIREGQLTAAVKHPNIVKIFDVGTMDDGHGFLALELLQGITTREEYRTGPHPKALFILDSLANALAACHRSGIVHRDVKPENVLLAERDDELVPTLIDFGLGKPLADQRGITEQGAIVGTPGYMAPEQVLARPIDTRTDVHGFGVTAYELLAGRNPFLSVDTHETLISVLTRRPERLDAFLDVPVPLADVVERCLSKQPEDRYPDALVLRDEWLDARRVSAA